MPQKNQAHPGKRTIIVVGATSEIGSRATDGLRAKGHVVRGVARSLGISLTDPHTLNRAFEGADSAYIVVPFDLGAADLHQSERQIASNLIGAITGSGVKRVVLLSGLNAHLKMGTSLGAAEMEDRLQALDLPELAIVRAGFFNENFIKGMGFVEQSASGVFASPFRGDLPMPMIAARDIGDRVAELLSSDTWSPEPVIELHGGGSHSFEDATAILARAMGRKVVYQMVPLSDAHAGMVSSGLSPSFADAVIETAASFNRAERWALQPSGSDNATPTTLKQWAEAAFASFRDTNRV